MVGGAKNPPKWEISRLPGRIRRRPGTRISWPAQVTAAAAPVCTRPSASGVRRAGPARGRQAAFTGNHASRRASRALGCEPSRREMGHHRAQAALMTCWKLTWDRWDKIRRTDIEHADVEDCLPVSAFDPSCQRRPRNLASPLALTAPGARPRARKPDLHGLASPSSQVHLHADRRFADVAGISARYPASAGSRDYRCCRRMPKVICRRRLSGRPYPRVFAIR